MKTSFPLCCSPDAFKLLGRQSLILESPDALVHGAVAIAMHHMPSASAARVDTTLQRYADRIRGRVRGAQPQALLAHLHDLLFEEEGFNGNRQDYQNPANSYLPAVLKSRRGLPITLCLIYKVIAQHLGLKAWGVGLPGHFLVAVELPGGPPMLIDPFNAGRIVTIPEAAHRLETLFGGEVDWSDDFLRPVSHRQWLTRMLQNLLNLFGGRGQYADVAAVLEMEMLLWPEHERLQRDLGLVLARLGLSKPASVWLDRYLQSHPEDPQNIDLRQLLEVLTA
jgi:regulator of sirC expression with transglutaminase-like and TPR domain